MFFKERLACKTCSSQYPIFKVLRRSFGLRLRRFGVRSCPRREKIYYAGCRGVSRTFLRNFKNFGRKLNFPSSDAVSLREKTLAAAHSRPRGARKGRRVQSPPPCSSSTPHLGPHGHPAMPRPRKCPVEPLCPHGRLHGGRVAAARAQRIGARARSAVVEVDDERVALAHAPGHYLACRAVGHLVLHEAL